MANVRVTGFTSMVKCFNYIRFVRSQIENFFNCYFPLDIEHLTFIQTVCPLATARIGHFIVQDISVADADGCCWKINFFRVPNFDSSVSDVGKIIDTDQSHLPN